MSKKCHIYSKKKHDFEFLYFSFLKKPFLIKNLAIYESKELDLCNAKFCLNIIGLSHCIYSKELDYCEIFSCVPIREDSIKINIEKLQKKLQFFFKNKYISAKVELYSSGFRDRPSQDCDLYYKFENNAHTSIRVIPGGYETEHSYPEIGKNIITRTKFLERNKNHQ